MAEEQLPDWLAGLSGQQLGAEKEPSGEGPRDAALEELLEGLQGPTQPDTVGDLRERIVLPEEGEFDYSEEGAPKGLIPGMEPWQGFVLALLFLLNVVVLGCLALLVTGKITLPF